MLCAKARNVTKVFKDLLSYKNHYIESEKHSKEFQPPFKCDRCDKSFILGEALIFHQKCEHSQEIEVLKCEYCSSEFFTKATKSVHEKNHPDAPKSEIFICNLCFNGVTFSVNELVVHHESFHEG